MGRIGEGVGAVGRRAGWIAAGAALAWSGPVLVRRVFGTPDWYRPTREAEALYLLVVACALTLVGLSTLSLSCPGKQPSRWRMVMVPSVVGALAVVALALATTSSSDWIRFIRSLDETLPSPSLVLVFAMLVVIADTLRRTRLGIRDSTIRMAVASGVIWLVGVWTSGIPSFTWACFSPIASAELAACGVAEAFPFRILCGLVATGCLASAIVVGRRRGARRDLLPLIGLAAWMASRAVVDLLTYHAALGLCPDGSLGPGRIAALAAAADVVGVAGYACAFGCWLIGAARSVAQSDGETADRGAWSSVWPLLPVLVLSTSAAFEPRLSITFPQQTPEAVWNEVADVEPITWTEETGYIPFFMTRADNVVSGVLPREGELHVFQGGRRAQLGFGTVLSPPTDHFWTDGVELVVDRQATLGDLRRAARNLRQSAGLSVVWRSNRLHEVPASATERWGFVEMASRALRARRIDLIAQPERCDQDITGSGPTARRRCALRPEGGEPREVLAIESPNEVLVRDWLVANADVDERFALVVRKDIASLEHARSVGGPDRPEDPLETRVGTPDLVAGLGAGLILGLLGMLCGVVRELGAVRRLARRGRTFAAPQQDPDRPHLPSWVRWRLATSRVLADATGGPYRAHGEVMVADERTAWCELRRVGRRAAIGSLNGTMRWVFLAVLACVAGFSLPLLIPG